MTPDPLAVFDDLPEPDEDTYDPTADEGLCPDCGTPDRAAAVERLIAGVLELEGERDRLRRQLDIHAALLLAGHRDALETQGRLDEARAEVAELRRRARRLETWRWGQGALIVVACLLLWAAS